MVRRFSEATRLKLWDIVKHTECSKSHQCVESDFQALCRVKDVLGTGKYLWCLEDKDTKCEFRMRCRDDTLCNCAVRFYMHMELGV